MVGHWQKKLIRSLIGLFLLLPGGAQAEEEKSYDLKPVTQERLLRGTADPSAWLMYGGDYHSWRYSALKDINKQNVKKLAVAWMFQTGIPGQLEASPIVADGILYLTASYNHAFALDAVTGEPIWKYDHPLPDDMRVCCGPTNRGVAIADDKVFMATLDARLVALDRRTGKVVWNVEIDKYANGFSSTVAPLVVKDKVIVGIGGGEYGVRGYIDAYDVKTGERKWRTYTTPGEGEKASKPGKVIPGSTVVVRPGLPAHMILNKMCCFGQLAMRHQTGTVTHAKVITSIPILF